MRSSAGTGIGPGSIPHPDSDEGGDVRPSWRTRARSAASILVLVVSVLATIATTPPEESLRSTAEGESFVLDAKHPLATSSITLEATEQAREGLVRFRLFTDELWTGVASRGTLEVSFTDPAGAPTPSSWTYEPQNNQPYNREYKCVGAACARTWQVSFRLPAGLERAGVRVLWGVEAGASFGGDPVPEGATIRVGIGELSGGAGSAGPVASGDLGIPRHDPYLPPEDPDASRPPPVVVERFDISVPRGAGDHVLTLGWPVDPYEPISEIGPDVTVVQPGWPDAPIAHGTGTRLHAPVGCGSGPCRFAVRVVVALRPGSPADWPSSFHWVLDAAPPRDGYKVTHAAEDIPSITTRAKLSHLVTEGDPDKASTTATIHVSSEALSGDVTPLVFARIALTDYGSDWPRPDADVLVELLQTTGGASTSWTGFAQPEPAHAIVPPGAILALPCRADTGCTFDVEVMLSTSAALNGPDAVLEATPVMTLTLLYPQAVAPDGASVNVSAALAATEEGP